MGNIRRLNKQMQREKSRRASGEVILRITACIDTSDQAQMAFAKAALTRLNILHAQCTPEGIQRILGDAQIRQHYDDAKRKTQHLTGSDPILRNPNAPNLAHSPVGGPIGAGSQSNRESAADEAARRARINFRNAASVEKTPVIASCPVTVQKFEPPHIQWRIKKIIERRMPAPLDLRIVS